jgi:phosphoribosylanthranilate isomerase
VKVKVCGITSYSDAAFALDQGVDALGFNFFPRSLRYIDPAKARSIIGRLPPFATTVGLFVNEENPEAVCEAARQAAVQVLQFHGDESPSYCRYFASWPLIKALRLDRASVASELREYPVHAFLLDSRDDALFGGTGKTFDWSLAELVKGIRPIVLAGGLKPENVGEAIREVQPYGVDVCSGVESVPGKKDAGRLIDFMNEVRNAVKSP